jgi:hypothetical protein
MLGMIDPCEVAGNLDSFYTAHLGGGVTETFFCELSVGAAFGLLLADCSQVLLKVHPDRRIEFLRAVYRVQGHLCRRGSPCSKPLVGPEPFGLGFATTEEFVDTGEFHDVHEPET